MTQQQKAWVEKYRPTNIDEIILPNRIKQNLLRVVKDLQDNKTQSTNLVLQSASAGTGKTTSALAICNVLGYDGLIINGSNEGRLLDTLRNTVQTFCVTKSLFEMNDKKAVIFDEADMLPNTVQCALRHIVEHYSDKKNILFIFTCNDVSNLIKPLLSRTTVIDYSYLPSEHKEIEQLAIARCVDILKSEKVYNENCLNYIKDHINNYLPDIRSFVNHLQFWISNIVEYNGDGKALENKGSLAIEKLENAINNKQLNSALYVLKNELRNLPVGVLGNLIVNMALEQNNDNLPQILDKVSDCLMNEYRVSNIDVLKMAMVSSLF